MSEGLAATISRSVGLSVDDAFRAWIDPEMLPLWLAPPPYDLVHAEVDARAVGTYRHDVVGPDGEHVVTGEYLSFTPSQHILKTWNYSGPNPAPRPEATFVEVYFSKIDENRSRIEIRHYGLRDTAEQQHYEDGWALCLERMDEI